MSYIDRQTLILNSFIPKLKSLLLRAYFVLAFKFKTLLLINTIYNVYVCTIARIGTLYFSVISLHVLFAIMYRKQTNAFIQTDETTLF